MILGRAEMLTDMTGMAPPVEQMRAQVEHVRSSAKRLTGMIESLMADAMTDALDITLQREPVDLAALAREVCAANRPLADLKDQSLGRAARELYLCGDGERLREAIDNLISNAIKYSFRGGAIDVRVWRDAAETVCAVSDQGPASRRRMRPRLRPLPAPLGQAHRRRGLDRARPLHRQAHRRAPWRPGQRREPGPGAGATFAIRFPNIAVELL